MRARRCSYTPAGHEPDPVPGWRGVTAREDQPLEAPQEWRPDWRGGRGGVSLRRTVNESPEGTIRRYLVEHGGRAQVPAYNLLQTWQIEGFTPDSAREVQEALERVDVHTRPPLAELDQADLVLLFVADRRILARGWQSYRGWPFWARGVVAPLLVLFVLLTIVGSLIPPEESSEVDRAADTAEQEEARHARQAEVRRERERLDRERAALRRERLEARRERARLRRARVRRARVERQRERERQQAAEAREEQRQLEDEQRRLDLEQEEQQQSANCDSNYSPCVPPFPPDVDCADIGGPVTVTGGDPHGLDRDGDGSACE